MSEKPIRIRMNRTNAMVLSGLIPPLLVAGGLAISNPKPTWYDEAKEIYDAINGRNAVVEKSTYTPPTLEEHMQNPQPLEPKTRPSSEELENKLLNFIQESYKLKTGKNISEKTAKNYVNFMLEEIEKYKLPIQAFVIPSTETNFVNQHGDLKFKKQGTHSESIYQMRRSTQKMVFNLLRLNSEPDLPDKLPNDLTRYTKLATKLWAKYMNLCFQRANWYEHPTEENLLKAFRFYNRGISSKDVEEDKLKENSYVKKTITHLEKLEDQLN